MINELNHNKQLGQRTYNLQSAHNSIHFILFCHLLLVRNTIPPDRNKSNKTNSRGGGGGGANSLLRTSHFYRHLLRLLYVCVCVYRLRRNFGI